MQMALYLDNYTNDENKINSYRVLVERANTNKLYQSDPTCHLKYLNRYMKTLKEGGAALQEAYLQLAALLLEVKTTCKGPTINITESGMWPTSIEYCLEQATKTVSLNTPEVLTRVGRILMLVPNNQTISVAISEGESTNYDAMMCFKKAYDIRSSEAACADACYYMALLYTDREMAATKLAMALDKEAAWLVSSDGKIKNLSLIHI